LFPRFRTLEQELQRHGRFAGAGSAFHEKEMTARKPSRQNIVEAGDASFGFAGC
jgi:hypothetical protein